MAACSNKDAQANEYGKVSKTTGTKLALSVDHIVRFRSKDPKKPGHGLFYPADFFVVPTVGSGMSDSAKTIAESCRLLENRLN